MAYNYDNFDARHYDLAQFRGPKPGTRAPDFDVVTPDGTATNVLNFDADFLVLEMGSLTCPLFQGRRKGMARLDAEFPDASFAILYVREAHPGEKIGAHRTIADKTSCAQRLERDEGEARRILIDDLGGDVHEAYGGYPNSVFIINRGGCVVWASDWNDTAATGRALRLLKAGKPANVRSIFKPVAPQVSLRTLGKGGRGSGADFLRSFPSLVWNNLIRRNLRVLLGRPAGIAPDTSC
ncbi:MAG TPA: hypothetical protein EYP31_06420 [Roseibacterium sp.]|nr:hypothetical protein [Roseibacterium sp.]